MINVHSSSISRRNCILKLKVCKSSCMIWEEIEERKTCSSCVTQVQLYLSPFLQTSSPIKHNAKALESYQLSLLVHCTTFGTNYKNSLSSHQIRIVTPTPIKEQLSRSKSKVERAYSTDYYIHNNTRTTFRLPYNHTTKLNSFRSSFLLRISSFCTTTQNTNVLYCMCSVVFCCWVSFRQIIQHRLYTHINYRNYIQILIDLEVQTHADM